MMQKNKISFIIPVFNAEKTILSCLDSIINQSIISNFEIIIVDNNCSDQTIKLAEKFNAKIIQEQTQGRAPARNKGASIATGDFLAFIDSDCILDSNWASLNLENFKWEFIAASQGQIIPAGFKNDLLTQFRYDRVKNFTKGSFILLDIISKNFPGMNSAAIMIRKEVFINIGGFDVNMIRHEDIDLSRRIFLAGYVLSCAPSAICHVYWHGGNLKTYLIRAINVGKSLSLYEGKWSKSKIETFINFFAYYISRFIQTKKISFIVVNLLLENIHLVSFLIHFMLQRITHFNQKKIFHNNLIIKNKEDYYSIHEHFNFSILTNKIVISCLEKNEFLILEDKLNDDFKNFLTSNKMSTKLFNELKKYDFFIKATLR